MKWKESIEEKVKQDVFIESFESDDSKVMDYIYKYFENFFDVKKDGGYILLERTEDKITFKVYSHQIEVKKGSTPSIQFKYYKLTEGFMDSLGQLFVPEMRFTHSGGSKHEPFSDDLLNSLLEKAFKGLVKNASVVVMKPF